MTEANTPAAPAPAPAPAAEPKTVAKAGQPAGPSQSPVNSMSSASQANQQAAAAGEAQGISAKDDAKNAPPTPDTNEPASLTPTVRFDSTGNDQIDQVANLIAGSKLKNATDIVSEITKEGSFSLTSKANLVGEFGADVANIIINQLEGAVEKQKEFGKKEGQRLKEYAAKRLGAENVEDTWNTLQQYVGSSSSDISIDDRKALNSMLEAGGIQAEMVINTITEKYKNSSGFTQQPNLLQGDYPTGDGFQAMSRKDYQQQIGPAIVKYGESSQEVQALRNRRAISMSRGIN